MLRLKVSNNIHPDKFVPMCTCFPSLIARLFASLFSAHKDAFEACSS